jgi:hypothetical protein
VRQQQRQQFGLVAVFLAVAGLELGTRKKQLVVADKLGLCSSFGLDIASALS